MNTHKLLNEGSKVYKMPFWFTKGGTIMMKANSVEDADRKLTEYLETFHLNDSLENEMNTTHVEWQVMDWEAEEIGN